MPSPYSVTVCFQRGFVSGSNHPTEPRAALATVRWGNFSETYLRRKEPVRKKERTNLLSKRIPCILHTKYVQDEEATAANIKEVARRRPWFACQLYTSSAATSDPVVSGLLGFVYCFRRQLRVQTQGSVGLFSSRVSDLKSTGLCTRPGLWQPWRHTCLRTQGLKEIEAEDQRMYQTEFHKTTRLPYPLLRFCGNRCW